MQSSSHPIVIVTPHGDEHAIAVRGRLESRGLPVRVIDTDEFPGRMHVTLRETLDHVEIDGDVVRPSSVYVRDFGLAPRTSFMTSIIHRWEDAGIPTYNPPSAVPRIAKPYQLAVLAAARLPVPETRWTNDPDAARDFASARPGVYRPIATGSAPVCLQELLAGDELRVFVLDGDIIGGVQIIDDRGTYVIEPFPITDATRRMCMRAIEVLGLRFAAVHLKENARGKLTILELDPSPSFLNFDGATGTNILGALCTALARPLDASTHAQEQPTTRGRPARPRPSSG